MQNLIKKSTFFVICLTLVACFESKPKTQAQPQPAPAPSTESSSEQLEDSEILKVKTLSGTEKIKIKDGKWKVYTEAEETLSIIQEADKITMKNTENGTVYTLTSEENTIQVFENENLIWKVTSEGPKTKFYKKEEFVFRTKNKMGKINIYDANGERTGKCKPKDYGYSQKNLSGTRYKKIIAKITPANAIYFCAPLDHKIAAFLWYFKKNETNEAQ